MARTKLPDPLARRYLLERELDPTKAATIAEAYLAEGREIEALDFLARANASDRLESLRSTAIERGDVFLLKATSRALADEPTSAMWTALREAAEGAGRERDAEAAMRLAAVEG